MNTTHVIIFPVADPYAVRIYTNESFLADLSGPNSIPFAGRPAIGPHPREAELSARAIQWFWDGGMEFTIEGVAFVRRSVR